MKNITDTQKNFVSTAKEMFGESTTEVSRQDVIKMINDKGVKYPVWLLKSPTYRIGRGKYSLPTFEQSMAQDQITTESDSE